MRRTRFCENFVKNDVLARIEYDRYIVDIHSSRDMTVDFLLGIFDPFNKLLSNIRYGVLSRGPALIKAISATTRAII